MLNFTPKFLSVLIVLTSFYGQAFSVNNDLLLVKNTVKFKQCGLKNTCFGTECLRCGGSHQCVMPGSKCCFGKVVCSAGTQCASINGRFTCEMKTR